MDNYELESVPFYFNPHTSVALFKGFSLARNRLPVVVKRHDFAFIQQKEQQVCMVQTLNAALAQAKVQHANSCAILEVQLEIDKTNCSIYHILEALEGDLEQDIELRQGSNRTYSEEELRQALLQTASVLASAHSQRIAHRDVKPSNIFKAAHKYKLGDFGSFFVKRGSSVTKAAVGDARYMSPQLRETCMRGSPYNPFKADVFALGASLLHMATLTSPETLITSELLDEAVNRQIEPLPCSVQFKQLLCSMLAYQEARRPTMQDLCSALTETITAPVQVQIPPPVATIPLPERFAGVFKDQVFLYETQSQQITHHLISINFDRGGSYIEWDRDTILCLGGHPASSAVYSLSLSSFRLLSLPSLFVPRRNAGVAKVDSSCYVFGGKSATNGELSTCEKMQYTDKRWVPISSMLYPRWYFTPCHFRSLLYLVAAVQPAVETFNARTETFTVLPICLPPDLKKWGSVAFTGNGELCLLTYGKQMARWKIETDHYFRLSDIDRQCLSAQQPRIVGALVLIACAGRLQRFSLDTYSFLD